MRYEPKIGEDFALSKEVIVAKTRHLTEQTRSVIALLVVAATVLALLITGLVSLYRGDFQVLQILWAVVAAPYWGGSLATTSEAQARMEKKTTRVQLELPESSMERLRALREKTEAASYAEVIKNSLRLYEALIKEAGVGNEVSIKSANGTEMTYRMIF